MTSGLSMGRVIVGGERVLVVTGSRPRRGEIWAFVDESGCAEWLAMQIPECRLDVFDWYVNQPPGYKEELAGEFVGLSWFFSDQTAKLQEQIARECTLVMGSMKEVELRSAKTDSVNRLAFEGTLVSVDGV